jgi:hypothetical protein
LAASKFRSAPRLVTVCYPLGQALGIDVRMGLSAGADEVIE